MRVRSLASAAVVCVLASCASTGSSRTVVPGAAFTLAVGQRAVLPDRTTLRYVGVTDDSRCRPEVTCIWAGEATITLDFEDAPGTVTRLSLKQPGPSTTRFGAWTWTVVGLDFAQPPRLTFRLDAN